MQWRYSLSFAAVIVSLGCSRSGECPVGDHLEPLSDEGFFAFTMPGWEKSPDIEKPRILFTGLMIGKGVSGEQVRHFHLNCEWPKKSDPAFNPHWDAPDRWNCRTEAYAWTTSGPTAYTEGRFGQPEGYAGGWYEPRDRAGALIETQPSLVDGGMGLMFPYVSIEGPGTLKVSCSKPLRDYRDDKFEEQFKGCDVLWQNLYVPAETFFRTTIGEKVAVPGIYVQRDKP